MNDAFIIVIVPHLHLATIDSCSVPASSRDRGKYYYDVLYFWVSM